MIKNRVMPKKIKNSGFLAMLFTALLAYSQIATAQITTPSNYPIIGSVTGNNFNHLPSAKPFKYRISTWPQHGTVTLLDELAGIYQYQSHPGYVGEDSFSLAGEIQVPGSADFIPVGDRVDINVTGGIQYKVTKTEDTQDGICDNDCSFSEAVEAANASPGTDVVIIPAGEYSISPQTITDHIIIDGENISQTYLRGNGFRINGTNLQISNLTYTGNLFSSGSSGTTPFITSGGQGGFLINLYRVSISQTVGFDSFTHSNNSIRKMLAFESEFLRYGCGVVLLGNEIIASRIVITEGGVDDSECPAGFSAIETQFSSEWWGGNVVNLFSSSIHNNLSTFFGLIRLWPGNSTTVFNMINTSIHYNANTVAGALIQMWGSTEANIINSTIIGNNRAPTFYGSPYDIARLSNNILAYNNGGNECLGDDSSIISLGNNFFTNSDNGCNLHSSDITNGIFSYDVITDYYSPLTSFQYIMPAYNQTDVIDGANNDYCPHVDIQGFQRPADGNFDGSYQCDIGAYESLSKKLNISANNAADSLSITISLNTIDLLSAPAEWWIYADTPMGPYYFDSVTDSWKPGQGVSFQKIISEYESFQTLSANGFPEGAYQFYFNVDTTIDGENNNMDNAASVMVVLEPPESCDANGDNYIDRNDIALILTARNTPASGSSDPRDNDEDGIITVLDARQCVLQCNLSNCAVQGGL